MRVTAVLPTLNEEYTIGELVQACRAYVDEVLVVDGGSRDATCEIASLTGAGVVRLNGLGMGVAIRYALTRATGEVLLIMDADGSHDPRDIPRLLTPIRQGEADLVIGCRVTGGSEELEGDPGHLLRAWGTKAVQTLVNLTLKTHLTDIQNGFRAIHTEVARSLGLQEPSFCIHQEMAVRCVQKGYRVLNVASREYCRRHGKSRLCLWKDGPRCLLNIFSLLLRPNGRNCSRPEGKRFASGDYRRG